MDPTLQGTPGARAESRVGQELPLRPETRGRIGPSLEILGKFTVALPDRRSGFRGNFRDRTHDIKSCAREL